jgi:Vacuolar protein sorting-associated protein 62
VRSYTLEEISTIVRRTAPILYLHDDEPYLPSSVDWYLEHATLVSKNGERIQLSVDSKSPEERLLIWEGEWPCPNDSSDYWLEVPEEVLAGDIKSARSYVSIRRAKEGFLDITHWFWYPGNGSGTARLRTLAFDTTIMTEEAVLLTSLGFHVSDWEHITIRVTDDTENRITEVYLSQHAGGHWLNPAQLEFEPSGHLAVYSSKNGHAIYPSVGANYTAHIKTAPPGEWAKLTPAAIEFWLRNDTQKGSRSLNCVANHEIVSIDRSIQLLKTDSTKGGVPYFGRELSEKGGELILTEPRWLQYPYRWGPETEQKITQEVIFEALKISIGPIMVYSALTVGVGFGLLGVIAGLLVAIFAKIEKENGKPGPKVKFTSTNFADVDSGPEPENLFHTEVMLPVLSWLEGAAIDIASWTERAGEDAIDWTEQAGEDAIDWTRQAGEDAIDWTEQAGEDAIDWTKQAGEDAIDWTKDAATDVGDALNPTKW